MHALIRRQAQQTTGSPIRASLLDSGTLTVRTHVSISVSEALEIRNPWRITFAELFAKHQMPVLKCPGMYHWHTRFSGPRWVGVGFHRLVPSLMKASMVVKPAGCLRCGCRAIFILMQMNLEPIASG